MNVIGTSGNSIHNDTKGKMSPILTPNSQFSENGFRCVEHS